jgi:hypothetical protein
MMPEEAPPPGTACVVEACAQTASVYVSIGDTASLEGERSVAMCDEHAAHWRAGG